MKELDERSLKRLDGVHEDLVKVVKLAIDLSPNTFVVTEGLRSVERQKQLVAAGASQTMRSRHLTGHAVDLAVKVGDEIRWDWPLYSALADIMDVAAHQLDVPLEWGGEWRSLKDGPHFQLPWADYPIV
jgi:peptidoglycan L-alanyl-D-glutamate endopeptidase CwlK